MTAANTPATPALRLCRVALLAAAGLCPSVCASTAQAAQIDAAHTLSVSDARLHVTSRWYLVTSERDWTFAVPLPAAAEVHGHGVAPIVDPDDARIVGVSFTAPQSYPIVLELELPIDGGDQPIPIALPPDAGWQRVEIEGDARLVPSVGAALPMHTSGYYAPGDVGVARRLRIDRDLDGRHPAGAAYLPGAMILEAGGVPGRLESGARRKRGLGVAAGVAFVSGIFVLGVVFRRQEAAIVAEQAQAICDDEGVWSELERERERGGAGEPTKGPA